MSELYLMVTITERTSIKMFQSLYHQHGVDISFITVGNGTAVSETLDYLGLEETEKAVILSIVTGTVWKKIKSDLQNHLKIDVPGTGIAFIVPLSSIGGKKPLLFLTEKQNFEKGEESSLKDTKYELLIVIANQGYTNMVMDAAREAAQVGGTVIHAKGTGMERAEKYLGVTLVAEKEMVFIVVKTDIKNLVMKNIMEKAGADTKAKAVAFSLPVTSTAGLRLMEDVKEEND